MIVSLRFFTRIFCKMLLIAGYFPKKNKLKFFLTYINKFFNWIKCKIYDSGTKMKSIYTTLKKISLLFNIFLCKRYIFFTTEDPKKF